MHFIYLYENKITKYIIYYTLTRIIRKKFDYIESNILNTYSLILQKTCIVR